jgi:hypothetical protein
MRFIIHELPYERPVAAGKLRYERDGVPTGAVESWRLTDAVDGYRFLRVDLDAREAASGRSTLFHLTLNPGGAPEQLKVRAWGRPGDAVVTAALLWEGAGLLMTRTVDGVDFEETAAGDLFWFPATMGLSLLRAAPRGDGLRGLTLDANLSDPAAAFALREVAVSLQDGEDSTIARRRVTLAWPGGERRVWFDADGWPVRMEREEGLAAEAEQFIHYGAYRC